MEMDLKSPTKSLNDTYPNVSVVNKCNKLGQDKPNPPPDVRPHVRYLTAHQPN